MTTFVPIVKQETVIDTSYITYVCSLLDVKLSGEQPKRSYMPNERQYVWTSNKHAGGQNRATEEEEKASRNMKLLCSFFSELWEKSTLSVVPLFVFFCNEWHQCRCSTCEDAWILSRGVTVYHQVPSTNKKGTMNLAEINKDDCNEQLCRWLVHSRSTFRNVENAELHSFTKLLNGLYIISSRMKIERHNCKGRNDLKLCVKALINQAHGRFSLTTDAWSFRVYRWYIAHRMDYAVELDRDLKCIIIFDRSLTLHTAHAAADINYKIIDKWI